MLQGIATFGLVDVVVLCMTVAVCYWFMVTYRRPRLAGLPGPPGYPLLGNVTQIDAKFTHITLQRWAEQYGEAYAVRVMTDNWLVVNSYEAIREVLVTQGDAYVGRPQSYRMRLVSGNQKDAVFANPLEHRWWNPLRKAMQRGIRVSSDEAVPTGGCTISQLIGELGDSLENLQGVAVDVYDLLHEHTMRTTFHFLFGIKPAVGDPQYARVRSFQRTYLEAISPGRGNELDAMPWLRYFGNKTYKQLNDANEECKAFWRDVWQDMSNSCREEGTATARDRHQQEKGKSALSFIADLLNPQSAHYDVTIDEENVRMAFVDLLIAATVTTTPTLYASLHVLVHHPQVVRGVQRELDSVLGKGSAASVMDRDRLPYTGAVILELLRYTSISPFSVPHTAIRDVKICGKYHIPAGTTVFPNLWILHHDQAFWKDPWIFRPERFLDQSGALLGPDSVERKHMVPFGAGPRSCIGEPFAMKRIFLFIVTLAQRFHLEPETTLEQCSSCDPRMYECTMALSSPRFKIRFVRR